MSLSACLDFSKEIWEKKNKSTFRKCFQNSNKKEAGHITNICIGEESFEHANVLSEKINFSALGGPGVAIFGPDDLHPMC